MSEHPGIEEVQATMRGPPLFVVFGPPPTAILHFLIWALWTVQ